MKILWFIILIGFGIYLVNRQDYKYDEDKFLEELKTYVDKTYNQHYSRKIHCHKTNTEFIIDGGHTEGSVTVSYNDRIERVKDGKHSIWK